MRWEYPLEGRAVLYSVLMVRKALEMHWLRHSYNAERAKVELEIFAFF
ncbi:hypothetical protein [Leptospira licerasiae]|nr:hypothetical protein [Leptospira licerasiae]